MPTKREGEFGLHLYVCKQMMPYDFATGNLKYTRYGVRYINYMEKWDETFESFMKEEHFICHESGI